MPNEQKNLPNASAIHTLSKRLPASGSALASGAVWTVSGMVLVACSHAQDILDESSATVPHPPPAPDPNADPLTFTSSMTFIVDDEDTMDGITIGDIVLTGDDAAGTYVLEGDDDVVALFELDDDENPTELRLRAGIDLNSATDPVLEVRIQLQGDGNEDVGADVEVQIVSPLHIAESGDRMVYSGGYNNDDDTVQEYLVENTDVNDDDSGAVRFGDPINSNAILIGELMDHRGSTTFMLTDPNDPNFRIAEMDGAYNLYFIGSDSGNYEAEEGGYISVMIDATESSNTVTYEYRVKLEDVNDLPTGVSISRAALLSGSSTVGTLRGVDQDAGETFTFELAVDDDTDDPLMDNALFTITRTSLSFSGDEEDETSSATTTRGENGRKELGETYTVVIEVTDGDGEKFTETLIIVEGSLYLDDDPSNTSNRRYSHYTDSDGNGLLPENREPESGTEVEVPENHFYYSVDPDTGNDDDEYYFLANHDVTAPSRSRSNTITLYRVNNSAVERIEMSGIVNDLDSLFGLDEGATFYIWAVRDVHGRWALFAETDANERTANDGQIFLYGLTADDEGELSLTHAASGGSVEDVTEDEDEEYLPEHYDVDLGSLGALDSSDILALADDTNDNDNSEFQLINGRLFYTGPGLSGDFENGMSDVLNKTIDVIFLPAVVERDGDPIIERNAEVPDGHFLYEVDPDPDEDDDHYHFQTDHDIAAIEEMTDVTLTLYRAPVEVDGDDEPQQAIVIMGKIRDLDISSAGTSYIWAVQATGNDGGWSLLATTSDAEPTGYQGTPLSLYSVTVASDNSVTVSSATERTNLEDPIPHQPAQYRYNVADNGTITREEIELRTESYIIRLANEDESSPDESPADPSQAFEAAQILLDNIDDGLPADFEPAVTDIDIL